MSFGFGVGDILTISGLAAQVYSAYKDAPDDYKHISMEVKSLQAIVDEARKYFDNTILSNSKRQEGKEALQGCQSVLEDLNSLIEKYKSLDSANRMQIFKRVKLGTEDIMTLRARLTSNTISLSNFIRRFVISIYKIYFTKLLSSVLMLIYRSLAHIVANLLKWRHA